MTRIKDIATAYLPAEGLQALIDTLRQHHDRVLGPRVREQAIRYETISSVADLPRGVKDEHEGGRYRLHQGEEATFFGFVVGPDSLKSIVYPPRLTLWSMKRSGHEGTIEDQDEPVGSTAILGVRPCELAALAVQDKVFLGHGFEDPHYRQRRERLFLVAVECLQPGAHCFCDSMGTGPGVNGGASWDLALTELVGDGRHGFLVRAGSDAGREMMAKLPLEQAGDGLEKARETALAAAAKSMGRTLDTDGLKKTLYDHVDHPHWEKVADRCLACANCTMVCPTCFCSNTMEETALDGSSAARTRVWDSCFNLDFTYIHGGHVRRSVKSRYRQWMTHKLASWQDQFGVIGCVGCGRCITWCPVGIDITREAAVLQGKPTKTSGRTTS